VLICGICVASISKQAIKDLIKRNYGFEITDDGAAAMARMIEKKAMTVSKFAVKNAKKEKRKEVTKKDLLAYAQKVGFDDA